MKRELEILRPLALGLLAGIMSWLAGAGAAQGQPHQVFPLEADAECSDEMAANIPVDAEIARSKVPPEFDLLLTPDGSAVLVFAAKICTWEIEGRVWATKELHAFIEVDGPFQVIPVPGAPVTLASRYVYRLFFEGEATEGIAFSYLKRFGQEDGGRVQRIEIQPFAPVRTGSVIENGTGGQGYRWTEYTTPIPPVQFGQTNFFYDDPANEARPWRVVSQAAQLFNLVGQGMIVLETDPGSRLGDFGPILMGPTSDVSPMRLHGVQYIE